MFRKTTMALAATLILGTTTLALADEFDPNLENRYPQAPIAFQSKAVALPQTHQTGVSSAEKAWMDRASQEVDGGGN